MVYVLVGIVLGLFLDPSDGLDLFVGIGVFFLFFLIGVEEIDIPGFVETLQGRFSFAAVVGFLVPFGINLAVT